MNNQEMTDLLKTLHSEELALRERKGAEYTTSDAFENFEVGARMDECTPQECAWHYMKKHLVSIKMHIDGRKRLTQEQLHEKISDSRLYLGLIYGMEKE